MKVRLKFSNDDAAIGAAPHKSEKAGVRLGGGAPDSGATAVQILSGGNVVDPEGRDPHPFAPLAVRVSIGGSFCRTFAFAGSLADGGIE